MYADLLLKEIGDTARFIENAGKMVETETDPDVKDILYSSLDRARNARAKLTAIGEIEDPEAKIAAAEDFLARFPDTRRKDWAYYLMADAMVEGLRDTTRFEMLAERVIGEETDPEARAQMYYMLYAVHVDTSPEKSLQAMEKLADNPIDVGWVYSYVASDISRRELDSDLAIRLCDRALEYARDGGDSAGAFDSRGWVYYGLEDYDKAIADLKTAVAIVEEPDEQYLEHLAKAALKAGDGETAFEALESMLVLGEFEFAKTTLDSLMDSRNYSAEQKLMFEESIWQERIDRAMPAEAFTLSDVSDAPFEFDPIGKVTVLDFMSPT
jgi:tetratricopeptide (TPR) repeat protein